MPKTIRPFDPVASAIELHAMLAVAIRNKGWELDMVLHGTSGVISVFGQQQWQGRGAAICDIHPTQHRHWYVEWIDGKMMNGNGGNYAFVKVLTDGIEANMKWVV